MTVKINEEFCKGCGFCVEVCPKDVLKLSSRFNKRGFNVVEVKNPDACIQCKKCELICPDFAINVSEREEKPTVQAQGA